jgi:hypothetical protein
VVELDYDLRERESSLIQQGDKKLLMAVGNLTVTPSSGDKVTVGANTHDIINVSPLQPGDTVILYELQVR